MSYRILFVSHEATRTGAPIVLLNLITWIRENSDAEVHILLLKDGALRASFEELGPLTCLDDFVAADRLTYLERLLFMLGFRSLGSIITTATRKRLRHLSGFDVAYVNSAVAAHIMRYLPRPTFSVLHVHELSTGLELSVSPTIRALFPPHFKHHVLVTSFDRFVAAADCVKDVLVSEHHIPRQRVKVQPEFIDVAATMADPGQNSSRVVRESLGISADARVILASGTLDWRKGPDLFIRLATRMMQLRPGADFHFIWVGGVPEGYGFVPLKHDVERAGLAERVHFIGSTPRRFEYFRMADVFTLTSREDPYPLVCLEASLLRLPIVSFDNGGMREFLADGAGMVVPYLDVRAMTDQVLRILDDHDLAARMSETAARKVLEHNDVAVGASSIYGDLLTALEGDRGAQPARRLAAAPLDPRRSRPSLRPGSALRRLRRHVP